MDRGGLKDLLARGVKLTFSFSWTGAWIFDRWTKCLECGVRRKDHRSAEHPFKED